MADLQVDSAALTQAVEGLLEADGKVAFGSEMRGGAREALGAEPVIDAFVDAVGQQQRRAGATAASLSAVRSLPAEAMIEFARVEARLAGVAHGYVP